MEKNRFKSETIGIDVSGMYDLIEKWETIARNKFKSAENQKEGVQSLPTPKRFIEHGAICYYNCAKELREALFSL